MSDQQERPLSAFEKGWAKGRGRTAWKPRHFVAVGSAWALTSLFLIFACSQTPATHNDDETEARGNAVANAQPCSTPSSEKDALTKDDYVLRTRPSKGSKPILNPNEVTEARNVVGEATVTPTTPLRAMCAQDGWTRVRVLITGQRWKEGWLPPSALRQVALDDRGHRIFSTSDIEWQPGSEQDKARIVKAANLILRDDKRCEAIDERSLLVEGTSRNRRYTLSCDGPAGSFPISFTRNDVGTKSFAMTAVDPNAPAAEPLSKVDAGVACMDAVRESIAGSVDFHSFTNTTYNVDGSRSRFTVGLTAQNGLGLEVERTAACVFEGAQLVSAEILPAGA